MNHDFIRLRSSVVKAVRRFFDERGYVEVYTPRLVGLPGQEPHLEPMWTEVTHLASPISHHQAALITSPEYAMKKLLAAGFDKIYDLGPCFRNGEPWDGSHDVEFLMAEWYRKDASLSDLMDETEALVKFVISSEAEKSLRRDPSALVGMTKTPFRRLTVAEAMKLYADVELDALIGNRDALAEVVRAHGQTVQDADTWDDLFFKIFLSEVEPKLGWGDLPSPLLRKEGTTSGPFSPYEGEMQRGRVWQPTFLHNYPKSMAALAKKNPDDPRYALRVELYIGNLELANGFAELADADEQRARFLEEQELRKKLGKKTWPLDERFLEALPKMGDAVGIAFGVDRLAMLLGGTDSISDLMPIPVGERF